MSPLVFVVAALCTYRITMLIVADEVTESWRDRIIERYVHPTHELTHRPDSQYDERRDDASYAFSAVCRCGMSWSGDIWSDVASEANGHVNKHRGEMTEGPKWLILLNCAWCASWWVGLPVAWSAWSFGERGWWFVPATALGLSAVTGVIGTYAKPGH